MLISNDKIIKIIGYTESSMTQEYKEFILSESTVPVEIITPDIFFTTTSKKDFQYIVGFSLDMELREKVCYELDKNNLDCCSFIHDSCYISPAAAVDKGAFIAPFSTVAQNARVGKHCCIATYCLISHYTSIKSNCILHSGAMIAGKSSLGKNSTMNFKSSILNNIHVSDNITLAAYSNLTKSVSKSGRYIGTVAKRF